ncbi:methyl-accepting chemotaxis protein [Shewanella sp. OMA3-2]|uniref:methyl-accepting chemotaxis protein n=1 Tax=Shewanella sp. OMA3-2 TaxID=2908650 RepID=UPI001F21496B|nr:PAS domain-containing methyl-accepting chemotaxis protein [Shewanella sp. OMA3-2]UJF22819.1 methyl-accepting chemotaxis protein [Shewanella sp. OMA3-2]
MRDNQPVTQKLHLFKPHFRLISGTDARGHIIYCNDEFVEVSGFEREELIGKPHNLIRHPDMPSAVFKAMWSCISSGKVWMGLVKNRRKNGDHYWVSAFVTPVYENNKIVGYESVRVIALPSEIARAEIMYARLRKNLPPRAAIANALQLIKSLAPVWLPLMLLSIAAAVVGGVVECVLTLVAMIVSSLWTYYRNESDWREVYTLSPDSFSDLLVAMTFFNDIGGKARAKLSLGSEIARCRTALTRIEDSARSLDIIADKTQTQAENTAKAVTLQSHSTQQIASAITQMSTAIQEVAGNVERNASSAKQAQITVQEGAELANSAKASIDNLNVSVTDIAKTVKELVDSTKEISQAASLISNIADQTNLLALNAAIEAARAGEQGRGFSVVADEVRALASKTRESTDKIHDIVKILSKRAENALEVSSKGELAAAQGVEIVEKTRLKLILTSESVELITQLSLDMSSAVEQQSAVAEHINQQIIEIADASEATKISSETSLQMSHDLHHSVTAVRSIIRRFAVNTVGEK